MALALLIGAGPGSAVAVVDLDAATPDTSLYARETLTSLSTTIGNADNLTYHNVADAGTALDITATLGASIPMGGRAFIRFQFEGGVFTPASNPSLTIDGSGANIVVVRGGAGGDTSVVYGVSAPAGFAATAAIALTLDAMAIPDSGPVGLRYSLFESASAALFDGVPLHERSIGQYINSAPGAVATFTPNLNTADVDSAFLNFTSASLGNTLARIGTIEYKPTAGALSASSGTTATVGAIANQRQTTVTLLGDFTFGSWFFDNSADCTSGDVYLDDSIAEGGGDSAYTDLMQIGSNGFHNLCVMVDGVEEVIQADEYDLNAEPAPANIYAVNTPVAIRGQVGEIIRNGIELRLPSLTTFSDYNQHIVLVNYRDFAIEYELAFFAEDGVVVTPLEAASGTLQPREKRTLEVADVVAIEGGTSCAATFAARARPGSVGVATTQVNLADGSTDTVVYQ